KSASEMSRKDEIFESETGLLSIAGGKLTGYRKMAERIIDLVADKFAKATGQNLKPVQTKKIPLAGGPFKNPKEVQTYTQQLITHLKEFQLEDYYAQYLVANYGKQSDEIVRLMSTMTDESPVVRLAKAEVTFTIDNELVIEPMDFFNRRSGRLYFDLPSIEPVLMPVLELFKATFQWDDERLIKEKEYIEQECYRHAHFEYEHQKATQN
ncbi:MAG: glycerol-3-phosphate dehydrogenase, partial [Saprospiraceae bacterium]|nr:glycerol-3-phosphate dehydrogenase [Saprospiraceae bacterium]